MLKKIILAYLMIIPFCFGQPGPTQTTEQGISNYQILPTTPTTTPIAGKQYLYNANDVLSTKDSLNNIQRVNKNYDNYVPNFDMEQGLLPYVFTGVTATLNTTTQLEGLKSINFDATAINDFIETPLITIPRILMGQVCMVKVNIRGGDANLKLSLVNGAGTEIGFKQLAVFADSTPQFITFNCPTQALITATPALGQLKIKLVQSTATNAALATLDSFYLGRFESNTMVVQEQVQEYTYASGTFFNGNFNFAAPSQSKNDKTLFTYAGTTLTALKPIILFFHFNAHPLLTTTQSMEILAHCKAANTNIWLNAQTTAATSATTMIASQTCLLDPGQTFDFSVNTLGNTFNYSITTFIATPLPQLATIVSTNQMRAGLAGYKVYSGCTYGAVTGNPAGVDFNGASCTAPTVGGLINTDSAHPYIGLSYSKKIDSPHGYTFNGKITLTGDAYLSFYNVTLGGVNGYVYISPDAVAVGSPIWGDANQDIRLRCFSLSGTGTCALPSTAGASFIIKVFNEPLISDPYSTPELFAALPPQVINSSGKQWRTESCQIVGGVTPTFGSSSCSTWVQSLNRTVAGYVTLNILPNIFLSAPVCTVSSWNINSVACGMQTSTALAAPVYCVTFSPVTGTDAGFNIICQGLTP